MMPMHTPLNATVMGLLKDQVYQPDTNYQDPGSLLQRDRNYGGLQDYLCFTMGWGWKRKEGWQTEE